MYTHNRHTHTMYSIHSIHKRFHRVKVIKSSSVGRLSKCCTRIRQFRLQTFFLLIEYFIKEETGDGREKKFIRLCYINVAAKCCCNVHMVHIQSSLKPRWSVGYLWLFKKKEFKKWCPGGLLFRIVCVRCWFLFLPFSFFPHFFNSASVELPGGGEELRPCDKTKPTKKKTFHPNTVRWSNFVFGCLFPYNADAWRVNSYHLDGWWWW